MGTGRRKLSGVNGGSATRVTGAERTAGAACAATELVRIAVMTAMVSKSDTDTVKQRRRRVSRRGGLLPILGERKSISPIHS